MGRLRASLARSDIDREMHRHLGDAGRSLQLALDLCIRVARGGGEVGHSPTEVRRARQYADSIRRARDIASSVGHLTPSIDMTDPDLIPEADKRPPERTPPPAVPVVEPELEAD